MAGRDGRWVREGAAHLHRGTVGRVFVAIRTRGHDARVCETPCALLSLGERCDATVLSNEGAAFTRAGAVQGRRQLGGHVSSRLHCAHYPSTHKGKAELGGIYNGGRSD